MTTTTKPQRLVALDVFRGLTIALMFTVNNPGTWAFIYDPLEHAKWHGWTPTDWVFPFFLFTVGVSAWFSLNKYQFSKTPRDVYFKIIKRGIMIFLIGLGLNLFLNSLTTFENLRIMGVLQRIGIAYLIGSVICVSFSQRTVAVIGGVILVGYWLMMKYYWMSVHGISQPAYPFGFHDSTKFVDIKNNIVTVFDNWVLGASHLYKGYDGIPFDPEGLLSTLPAIVTVFLGFFTGKLIDSKPDRMDLVKNMALWGAGALILGWMLNLEFPINKPIWSSSYVIFMAGWCLVINALLIWLIDIKPTMKQTLILATPLLLMTLNLWYFSEPLGFYLGQPSQLSWLTAFAIFTVMTLLFSAFNNMGVRNWIKPILVLGMNSMLAFVISGMYVKIVSKIKFDSSYETVVEKWNNNAVVPKRIGGTQKLYEEVFSPLTADRTFVTNIRNKVFTKENNPSVYASFEEKQKLSSFFYALFHVFLFWLILWVFYRFNIFLKV
jgi:predicted acyltransferase